MDDLQRLLQRCQSGEQQALGELFRKYRVRIYRLAVTILRDEQDAEDATQDVFVRLYLQIGSYRGQASFDTWLTTVILNVCRDRLRRQKVRRTISLEWLTGRTNSDQPEVLELIHERQQKQMLWRLVDRLEDRLRLPIILVYQEGLSIQEAAKALDLPLSTVYSQLNTAFKRLKEMQRYTFIHETKKIGKREW